MLLGLISDTHGVMRPEALAALQGVHGILHAGDVGGAHIIADLETIAPVRAVCGNVDLSGELPASIDDTIDGVRIHVSHGHELGSPTPERLVSRYAADIIVYGHTHRALVRQVQGTLVINPGAAGPRRFNLRPTIALLSLPDRDVRLVELVPTP